VSQLDAYLDTLDASTRGAFEHVRELAVGLVPGLEEGRSYGMAALKYQGKPVLGFLATKQHLSIFPFSPAAVDAVRDRLDGYDLSKGTIRFTTTRPLPDEVVRDVVRHRVDEISGARR